MKPLTIALAGFLLLGCPKRESAPPTSTESSGESGTDAPPTTGPAPTESTDSSTVPSTETNTATESTDSATDPGTGGTTDVASPPTTDSPIPPDKKYKGCELMRPITKGDRETVEGTLWLVFQALLIKDDSEAFEAFYALIDPDFQRRESARNYWFAAARKYGGKNFHRLVFSPNDPSYVLCEVRQEPPTAIRLFVGKSPPVGSNPPYSFHKKNGKWLMKTFAPH